MSATQELDDRLFPGALAPFRSGLVLERGGCPSSAAILDRPRLIEQLTRFQQSVNGPWQPACSLWAQLYFNTLLIPATCLLSSQAECVERVLAISTSFCPVSGSPRRCALLTDHPDRHRGSVCDGLADDVAIHVTAMIADLNAVSRLSKGLLREHAERAVTWALDQIRLADPARFAAAETMQSEQAWRRLSPFQKRYAPSVRRYCCLRDRIPNTPSCGDGCPRDEQGSIALGPSGSE